MRLSLLLALCVLGSQPAWALDITACGATVPPGETGVLQADLLCSGEYAGVTLENQATLDMNGHSIRGPAVKGVICTERRCAVMSGVPGSEISGVDICAYSCDLADERIWCSDPDKRHAILTIEFELASGFIERSGERILVRGTVRKIR